MLCLSRQRDESIVFTTKSGERIEVYVLDIRGDKVRLGCHAPDEVSIHRKEVQDAIDRNGGIDRNPKRHDADREWLDRLIAGENAGGKDGAA